MDGEGVRSLRLIHGQILDQLLMISMLLIRDFEELTGHVFFPLLQNLIVLLRVCEHFLICISRIVHEYNFFKPNYRC